MYIYIYIHIHLYIYIYKLYLRKFELFWGPVVEEESKAQPSDLKRFHVHRLPGP